MTVRHLFAVLFIFASTAVAWFILGASVATRTSQSKIDGGQHVASLWGGQHSQLAPKVFHTRLHEVSEQVTQKNESGKEVTKRVKKEKEVDIILDLQSSSIDVRLDVDHRRKGLLWYDTYTVDFKAVYLVRIPRLKAKCVTVDFQFPSPTAIYDDFSLSFAGQEVSQVKNLAQGVSARFEPKPGQVVPVEVRYRSRGLDSWSYRFGESSVGQVRDFKLAMTTDFTGIDFPAGALSPTRKTTVGDGWRLEWSFDNLVSGQHIGVDVPNKLNPGPLTARITFFAPVSLLFFITVLLMLGALGHLELHPMHYFFLSAAFFSFHLLMAYLVDQINIHWAFAIAAAVSLILVLSYLRLICGLRRALRYAGSAQFLFLVLFSYAFFFEGLTGLAVTIGSILTLFALMQLTARVDWNRALQTPSAKADPLAAQ